MTMTVKLSQLPGISRLTLDYLSDFERVKDFYAGDPRKKETYQEAITRRKNFPYPAKQLAPILWEQNHDFGMGEVTFKNIAALEEGTALAILTGQQPGLFSGPLYTIYKATTAIKLAEYLSHQENIPIVPVFWIASDDHDFEEANHINLIDQSHQLVKLQYQPKEKIDRVPLFALILEENVLRLIEELKAKTPDTEFKTEILSALTQCYRPGSSWVRGFGQWLGYLFKDSGLILVEPSHPRLRALGKSVFSQELEEDSPSTRALLKVSKELERRGYHQQIQLHEDRLNLFFVPNERLTVYKNRDSYLVGPSRQKFSRHGLLALLDEQPQSFSPNVVLRPLYQDVLFPTIVYVAGPGEIAYFAQLCPVYQKFGLPLPVIYPRVSLTIVEQKLARLLEKYKLTLAHLFEDAETLINNLLKDKLPTSLKNRITNLRTCLESQWHSLNDEVVTLDPTLEKFLGNTWGKINYHMESIEKKVLLAYKRKDEIIRRQIYQLKNNLYPDNQLQERQFNILPYLIKYGFQFIEQLSQYIDFGQFDHFTLSAPLKSLDRLRILLHPKISS